MDREIKYDGSMNVLIGRTFIKSFIGLVFAAVLTLVFSGSGFSDTGHVIVSWDNNSDADYYVVYWKLGPDGVEDQSGNIGNVTSYRIDGLEAGKDYSFSVKAFNNYGNSSDYSHWISAKIVADASPVGDEPIDDGGVSEPVGDELVDDGGVSEPVGDELVDDGGGSEPAGEVLDDPDFVAGIDSVQIDSEMITEAPGEKSTDGFIPQTASVWVDDDDGSPTIEVLDTNFDHLYWLKSGWNDYNELNGESRVAMGDIDADGENEIVIGYAAVPSDPMIPAGFFQILDDDYSHLAWGRVEWDDYNAINGETRPVCGDIDGDGKDEIVIGLGSHGKGYMEVFDFAGGILIHESWLQIQWQDYNDMIGEVRPVCGDIDGDGVDEIIVGLSSESGTSVIPGGKFEVFGFNAISWDHILWGTINWPEYTEINGETWPEAGDLDGDGSIELVVGLGHGSDGQIAVFEFQNGEAVLAEWAQLGWPEYNEQSGETRPVCGDIDSDGKDDVIVGWNSTLESSDQSTYFKVLSYSLSAKALENFKDSKTVPVDIDSRPIKGVLTDKDNLVVGLAGGMAGTTSENTGTDQSTPLVGAEASGSGCFVTTVK